MTPAKALKLTDVVVYKFKLENINDINWGYCYYWAAAAYKLFKTKLLTVDKYGGHAFIEYKEKYYDALALNGVSHWSELNFFKDKFNRLNECDAMVQSFKDFKDYWRLEGAVGFDEEILISIIKLYKESK